MFIRSASSGLFSVVIVRHCLDMRSYTSRPLMPVLPYAMIVTRPVSEWAETLLCSSSPLTASWW